MEPPTQTALVLAAQAGDQMAFESLVGLYRRELLVHCYRMLGSLQNAEDLVQETLLRAWEKRATLTSSASYRAWLYRIATNLCLNTLTRVPRRLLPPDTHPQTDPRGPVPPRLRESIWLEPFPDDLLADEQSDPEDRAPGADGPERGVPRIRPIEHRHGPTGRTRRRVPHDLGPERYPLRIPRGAGRLRSPESPPYERRPSLL